MMGLANFIPQPLTYPPLPQYQPLLRTARNYEVVKEHRHNLPRKEKQRLAKYLNDAIPLTPLFSKPTFTHFTIFNDYHNLDRDVIA